MIYHQTSPIRLLLLNIDRGINDTVYFQHSNVILIIYCFVYIITVFIIYILVGI